MVSTVIPIACLGDRAYKECCCLHDRPPQDTSTSLMCAVEIAFGILCRGCVAGSSPATPLPTLTNPTARDGELKKFEPQNLRGGLSPIAAVMVILTIGYHACNWE